MPDALPRNEPPDPLEQMLARPRDQRIREYKYRFAQAMVFGLPVIGLELFGSALGGRDAQRWVGLLQALLTGWVVYVGAVGMAVEALLLCMRRKITVEFFVAFTAIAGYLLSLVFYVMTVVGGIGFYPLFAGVVTVLIVWNATGWWRGHRQPT